MPAIPQYQQQTRAQGPLSPGPIGDRGEGAIAQLGHHLAADAQARQVHDLRVEEENSLVLANDELQSARSSWAEQIEKRKQEAPAGATDFTHSTLKDFDDDAKQRIGRARTQRAREYLRDRLGAVRLGIQDEAQNFERGSAERDKVQRIDKGLDGARTAAEFRPQDFEEILAEQSLAIAGSGLTDEQRVAASDAARKSIASAAVQGMIRRDPYAARDELNNEKSKSNAVQALDFDDRQRLRNAAEAEIRRIEAEREAKNTEARQAMNDRLRDIAAAAALGIPITETPDEATLKGLYGNHEGAERYKAVQRAAQLSSDVSKMNSLPTAELLKQSQAAQPKQVAGAADQAQLAGFVENRTEAIIRAREKDGAGYLVAYSPAARDAWGKFLAAGPEEREQATAGYLSAVRAERERLQIPGDDVLPNSYAEATADSINSAPTAEQLATTMEQESARWGSAWPQVYAQLAPKISDMAAVIGSGIPRAAATALASTGQMSESELKALLPPGTKPKDVDEDVDGKLEDFARSFPSDAARTFNAFTTSAKRLTAKYMHDGASRKDAVQKAYDDLIGNQYQMVEFRGTPMRIPTSLDDNIAELGAQHALEQYEAITGDVMGDTFRTEEEALGDHTRDVRERGYWMTNPAGTGLRLYVDGGPVSSAAAGHIEVSWEQLRVHAAAQEEQDLRELYQRVK